MIQGFPPITPVEGYQVSDTDTAGPYYGYIDAEGHWYIMKETTVGTVTSYTFAKGDSAYSTNWANRATTLTYDTFDNVF